MFERQVQTMVLDAAQNTRFAEVVMPEATVPISAGNFQTAGTGFTPQLMISAADMIIGVSQDTPKQLLADVIQVIRNA